MKQASRLAPLWRGVGVAVVLLSAEFAVAGGSFAVRNGTVAGGGGEVNAGPYRLVWTIGEPAMGTTSTSQYRLTAGYPATIPDVIQGGPVGGRIFADGFED